MCNEKEIVKDNIDWVKQSIKWEAEAGKKFPDEFLYTLSDDLFTKTCEMLQRNYGIPEEIIDALNLSVTLLIETMNRNDDPYDVGTAELVINVPEALSIIEKFDEEKLKRGK
jgi:hypothetical protein